MSRDLNVRGFVCLLAIVCAALFAVSGCGHSGSGQIPDPEIVAPPTPDVVVEQAIDSDGDGVLDENDNCPTIVNPEQTDLDDDGVGDACDEDIDGDGVPNSTDNCVVTVNPDQIDWDGDKMGDVCDPEPKSDIDDDNIGDGNDNCPDVLNPDQADLDGDGIGDICDDDIDGDGVLNDDDNCIVNRNPLQENMDGDGYGDVCDPDKDGDGICNENETVAGVCVPGPASGDNCLNHPNGGQEDFDDDGIGDACDDDTDGDGVLNVTDNCQNNPNADCAANEVFCDANMDDVTTPAELATGYQADLNDNGIGDACDPDIDGDGKLNGEDNCPVNENPGQEDMDGDGYGDVCDDNIDGDGWNNDEDNCPRTYQDDQLNSDKDPYVPKDRLAYETDEPNKGGDVCDIDDDNDGVLDNGDGTDVIGDNPCTSGTIAGCDDNCQFKENFNQVDTDDDGIGNVCDPDIDGDGIFNTVDGNDNPPWPICSDHETFECYDNCIYLANPLQENFDLLQESFEPHPVYGPPPAGDVYGDVCDADKDNDTYSDMYNLDVDPYDYKFH